MSFVTVAKHLRNSLRQRRQDLGFSQSELDDIIGNGTGLVAKWEKGFRNPSSFSLYSWAKALNCDIVLVPRPETEADVDRRNRPRPSRRTRNR